MESRHWISLALTSVLAICGGCTPIPHAPEAAAVPPPPTSAAAGDTTIVAIAAPAAPGSQQTLPQYLGINGLGKGLYKGTCALNACLRNQIGMRLPGLAESMQLDPALPDPANMDPNAPPAVQAAAEIQAEESGAAEKTLAIRYLARFGCAGCYPGVEDALLAALDDCTESVRYEAVCAFRDVAGDPCTACKADSCCSPRVRRRLDEIAHKMNNQGCFEEPSSRVRRIARLALNGCGGGVPLEPTPAEGPSEELPTDENVASGDSLIEWLESAEGTLGSEGSLVEWAEFTGEMPADVNLAPVNAPTDLPEPVEEGPVSVAEAMSILQLRETPVASEPTESQDGPRETLDFGPLQ